ncbi:ABC transporter substrate-binding protein [Aquabacterium sp. OR-4]|uniref:ABC transporter substrate-binding protein n=1 Tax=Aquabacterium sp. OR-4 TaxID=2978127 RepID=UPI0028CAF5F5|nr:helical backbone metal receptor [Aquabacterium sp. OR-4]MDT7836130.1 helical backbone metal receptor [Aquabacterium sp. OR-4]
MVMSNRWLRRSLLLAALALPGLGPLAASAAPLEIRDDRGTVHRLATPPQRIVTLLPSLTESVWALGGGARLVGVDRYSNWPEAIARLPRLGGLDDVQIEAIAALRPDVVLASTSARSLDRLEALGFTVVRLKSETQADVRRSLGLLARLLGTPAEGERVWATIDARIVAAAQRVPAAQRGQRVYFEIGGGPWAAGTSSFMGELLARLGLGNIVPPAMGPFPKLNPEYVLRERPDIVMGPRREADDMASRPGWASLAALQQRQRCAFETPQYELLIRPGPRMGEAAEVLADCLQALPPRRGGARP